MQFGQVALRQRIFGVDRVEPDQLYNLVARRQVLAGIDDADAEFAGKGRAYRLLLNHCLFRGDLRFGAVQIRLRLVQIRSRTEVVADDLRDAITRNFGKATISLQCIQLCLVYLDIELDQQFSLIDMLPGVEIDLANDPRHFGRDHDPARRRDRTDRLQRGLPALARDGPGGYDRGGRAGIGSGLFLHLQIFPAEYATENERKKYEYYSQSFDQGIFAELIGVLKAARAGAADVSL